MSARQIKPHVGEVVRHQPSGLPARVQDLIEQKQSKMRILFADGVTMSVPWNDIERNVTEEEKARFARDLVLVRTSQR